MLEEFKKFAMRGNVVDLAIGVIIGAAFGAIVNSLVCDIVMPIIGSITGGLDFYDFSFRFRRSSRILARRCEKTGRGFCLGHFLTVAINFMIIAWVLFLAIKGINRLNAPKAPPEPPGPSPKKFSC